MHVASPQPFVHAQPSAPARFALMTLPQPPDESSEPSFWAAVYDEDPPHIICGLLTDLNLHRFTLHQHLTTNAALTETPLLHQTFQASIAKCATTIPTSTLPTSTCAAHWTLLMPWVRRHDYQGRASNQGRAWKLTKIHTHVL